MLYVEQAPLARPCVYAFEGNAAICKRVRENIEDLTREWEERGSALLLRRILCSKSSEWSLHSQGYNFQKKKDCGCSAFGAPCYKRGARLKGA